MSDSEARRKKLEELKKRKAERLGGNASIPEGASISDIVMKVLNESTTAPIQEEVKEEEKREENVVASPKKKQDLKLVHFVGEIAITPKEKIETYSQEVQVDLGPVEEIIPRGSVGRSIKGHTVNQKEIEDEEDQMTLPQKGNERRINKPEDEEPKENEVNEKPELNQDEVKNILKTKDFRDFFERSTKMIEKALDAKGVDLLEDILLDENAINQDHSTKKDFQELHTFFEQQHTSNRVVTSIEWSPNVPELFLASYSQSFEGNPNEPQGALLLWSLSLRSRPEFTCFCQSQVTVAKFNPYSPSTVVGGTYSGQIVIWDLRTKSTPVQRSGMAGGGHAHPVYSLAIVGTQNSHNIVSLSNDGKLCLWNTSMLTAPQKEIDLKLKPTGVEGAALDIINATCLTFPNEEANNFFVGCEDGTIYSAHVHGNQANENIAESFVGHQAPITSLSLMPFFPDLSSDASNLLLSSSMDWTVKLWNPKVSTEAICSFEASEDYIYDVSWNPSNPALFSSVDGEGYIDIWDLSRDIEVPYLRHKGDTRALNKASWSRDGSKLLTGSADGNLKLYGLHKNLLKPNTETMDKFDTQIYNLTKKDKKD